MQSKRLKYAAAVFLGGASYGIMGTLYKVSYGLDASWQQTVMTQEFFGFLLFAAVWAVQCIRGAHRTALTGNDLLKLLALGLMTATTACLYGFALTRLPVATGITMLFQFTWMGMVAQSASLRKLPHARQVAATAVVLAGTVLASGLISGEGTSFDPLGMACALAAAISCTAFMFYSGRVGTGMPAAQRGMYVCLGGTILAFILCPTYFVSPQLPQLAPIGLGLGLFGLVLPVSLFGIGCPHLPTGISTILASSELPGGIFFSWLLLGEQVDWLQIVGVLVILFGVVLSQVPSRKGTSSARRIPNP